MTHPHRLLRYACIALCIPGMTDLIMCLSTLKFYDDRDSFSSERIPRCLAQHLVCVGAPRWLMDQKLWMMANAVLPNVIWQKPVFAAKY